MRSFGLILLLALGGYATQSGPRRPSILYLMCDDLRPQLRAYGFNQTLTPNLDALAAKSLVFNRAYTQFPFCAPSRNSFMSGRRPDRTR
jgi:arylsulfatase A-like enzyme